MDLKDLQNDWIKEFPSPLIIAGPCSAESEAQMLETAQRLKESGAEVPVFRAVSYTHLDVYKRQGKPIEKKPELSKVEEKKEIPSENPEKIVKKIAEPIAKKVISSEFSIHAALNKKEEEEVHLEIKKEEELPEHHFSEVDLQREWQFFLNDLQKKDAVLYYAVNTCLLYTSRCV